MFCGPATLLGYVVWVCERVWMCGCGCVLYVCLWGGGLGGCNFVSVCVFVCVYVCVCVVCVSVRAPKPCRLLCGHASLVPSRDETIACDAKGSGLGLNSRP
jgi:hypothetical protein